jgi:diadenosine tetraphosphate (Ap4A) HIT family hydrolase
MTVTAIQREVELCRAGGPRTIARLASGWAVMGERQVLAGYCLLLPDPVVGHLNALDARSRNTFLCDLGRLGEAVLGASGALRVNYAIFGNQEPALHAHVHPRYVDEPAALRRAHPWAYDWSQAPLWSEAEHGALREAIAARLAASA